VAAAPPTAFRLTAGNLDTALRYHAAIELLAERWLPGLEILEVGSGSGGVTEFLRHPVVGVDPDFERTDERTTEWLERRAGRATALPAPDESFDAVLCLEMLEHLSAQEREPALREMLRVLRPGGRLVLTFPAGEAAERLDRWLNERFRARHGREHPWAAEHLREGLPSSGEVADALARAAGPLASICVAGHLPGPAFRILHGLYTVGFGSPWTTLAGLRSRPAAAAAFALLRRVRGGECYRAVVVVDKPLAPPPRPEVSVVVPSWNGRELLDGVLRSLQAQTLAPLQVIVVDNGSSDGTVEHLAERWPEVEVVALLENAGFAAAVNRGVERARGEHVALVNNDVELDPGFLEAIAQGLAVHPHAGSAASKMLAFHARDTLDAAGDRMWWTGVAMQRGQGERDDGRYDRCEPVFSACAGAALYRHSALEAVGGFDEAFFAYLEDVDWGLRAQLAGYECVFVPTAVAYHVGSATTARAGARDPFFYGLPRRNSIWLTLKSLPATSLARHGHRLLGEQAVSFGVSARDGMARAHLAALRAALLGLPRVLRQRAGIRRAVGPAYLERIVTRDPLPRRRLLRGR
jgi:GT2 family glycosyltransferase/SAM-dependent methyltransferase